jgi:hypothetical protein
VWAPDSNHSGSSGVAAFSITAVNPSVVVSGYTGGPYDGSAHTQTVTVSGVGSDGVLYTTSLSGTNAGSYSLPWSFSSNSNYNPVSGTLSFTISKASSSTTVTDAGGPYTGGTYGVTAAAATGAGGLDDTNLGDFTISYYAGTYATVAALTAANPTALVGGAPKAVGSYTALAVWTPDSNHSGSSGVADFGITAVNPSVVVSGYTGGPYDGSAHTQTVTVTGVGSDGVLYTTSLSGTNAGSYSLPWSFSSNSNYNPVSGTLSFTITAVNPTLTTTPNVTSVILASDCQVSTTLQNNCGTNDNFFTLSDASACTPGEYVCQIGNEQILCSYTSGNTCQVLQRGYNGTQPCSHNSGGCVTFTPLPTLTDTATLAGGYYETGTITFTLYNPNDIKVANETVTVSGNGSYTTPTAYSLPTSGTVTGTYQWDASYSGNANNNPVSDNNDTKEQVKVAYSPTLKSFASPTTVTLGSTSGCQFSATLLGNCGSNDNSFNLWNAWGCTPGEYVCQIDNEQILCSYTSGNTCQVLQRGYNGTQPCSHNGGTGVTLTLLPTLTDTATLSGGYDETGKITFTLDNPSDAVVDTETVTVCGNGTYTTSTAYTLPTSGTVAGTYTWHASYAGDADNFSAVDQGGTAEQTVVNKATPTVVAYDAGGVYTGNPFTATATVTGMVSDGTLASSTQDSGTLTFSYYAGSCVSGSPLGVVPTNTGTYTVVAHYASDNANYNSAGSAPVTFTIYQASLPVIVASDLVVAGNSPPALTGTVNGVAFTGSTTYKTAQGDTVTVTLSTSVTAKSSVGVFPIVAVVTGAANANYVQPTAASMYVVTVGRDSGTGAQNVTFWDNQGNAKTITAADLTSLDQLNLMNNNDGSNFNPTTAAQLQSWFQTSSSSIAEALSVQLAVMDLNVLSGDVSAASVVYAGNLLQFIGSSYSVTGLDGGGFITVGNLMTLANNALAQYMTTVSYTTAVANYLNALEAALQAVNNNTDFVQQAVPAGS